MKVFVFDLLPYGKHFDQYKQSKYLPYPLPLDHYDREIAARTRTPLGTVKTRLELGLRKLSSSVRAQRNKI